MPTRIIVIVSLDLDVLSDRHLEEVDVAVEQLQALPGACVSGWDDAPSEASHAATPTSAHPATTATTHRPPSLDE